MTREAFLKEQALVFVNHYREVIVFRVKEYTKLRDYLTNFCNYLEYTSDQVILDIDKFKELYNFDHVYKSQNYNENIRAMLKDYRSELIPYIAKEMITLFNIDIESLEREIDALQMALPEYDHTDPEDMELYNEDLNLLERLNGTLELYKELANTVATEHELSI